MVKKEELLLEINIDRHCNQQLNKILTWIDVPIAKHFKLVTVDKKHDDALLIKGYCRNGEIFINVYGWKIALPSTDGRGLCVRMNEHEWWYYPCMEVHFDTVERMKAYRKYRTFPRYHTKIGSDIEFYKFKPMQLAPGKYDTYPSTYFMEGYQKEKNGGMMPKLKAGIDLEKKFTEYFQEYFPSKFNVIRVPLSGYKSVFKDIVLTTQEDDYAFLSIDIVKVVDINGYNYLYKPYRTVFKGYFSFYLSYSHLNDPFKSEPCFLDMVDPDSIYKTEKRDYKRVIPLKIADDNAINFQGMHTYLESINSDDINTFLSNMGKGKISF